MSTLGIIGLGTGTAALGAAVVFEVMRETAEANAEGEREQIRYSRYVHEMETDRTAARVLGAAGAALVVTGGILLFLGADGSHVTPGPNFALHVSPKSLGADATWRF